MYVVITGASRGIGKALASIFASHKYNLILTCEKNIDILNKYKIYLEDKYNIEVRVRKGLLDENFISDIKDSIYILINNAGKCDYNLIQDISYDRYKEIIYSNLDYTFLTTKLLVPYMIKNKQGLIVNMSSMWGIYGSALETIYSMTKGGINAFTKALAKELKESNIDVVAFALGMVDTDMNNHLTDSEKKEFVKTLDNGKMYTVSEIATMIYDIVSNKKYDTADIIEINNGLK